jgi:hypothetical protein
MGSKIGLTAVLAAMVLLGESCCGPKQRRLALLSHHTFPAFPRFRPCCPGQSRPPIWEVTCPGRIAGGCLELAACRPCLPACACCRPDII